MWAHATPHQHEVVLFTHTQANRDCILLASSCGRIHCYGAPTASYAKLACLRYNKPQPCAGLSSVTLAAPCTSPATSSTPRNTRQPQLSACWTG